MFKKSAVLSMALFALLLTPTSWAQSAKGVIAGHVADAADAALQGARIRVEPGGIVVTSDRQGDYLATNLAPGSYTVSASFVGFSDFSGTVTVAAGQTANLDITMKVAGNSEQVQVTAPDVSGDVESINRTRTSPNILNVLTNQQIMSLPNFTIADALGRLPGVTLERDEGDGKYVQIRGTEPRLSNTTLDGVRVPSPESGVRQVKLDTVPADLVESVEINKTLSANQDADAIGGSVNLVTKTAKERPILTMFGEGGYTPIIDGRHASQYGVTAGKRFGGSHKFGLLGTFTYDYNGRGIDDIEPTPDIGTLTPTYDSIDLREYRYDRTRWGTTLAADYKFNQNSDIYGKAFYSDFKDYGDKWVYTLNDDVSPNPDSPTGDPATITGDTPKFSNSKRRPDYGIAVALLGGRNVFTNSWFNWEVAASRARQTAAGGNPGDKFKPATGALKDFASQNCYYDPTANPSKYRPQWYSACTAAGTPVFDPTQYMLTELDLTSGQTSQINLQAGADYAFNYHLDGKFSTLQLGAKVRNEHKGQFAFSPTYDNLNSPDNASGFIPMSQFLSPIHNNHYYDGSYRLGPLVDYDSIVTYFQQNPALFPLDVDATHIGSDASNFNLQELISAGYIMNTTDFGKTRVQIGVRFEGTDDKSTGYIVLTNPDGSWGGTTPAPGSRSYLDILPSIQIKYAFSADSAVRVSYGRGLTRPDPQDLIPYVTLDTSQTPAVEGIGNPALRTEYANNFDIIYERYLNPLGLLQVGAFYKDLHNPLITDLSFANSPMYGPTYITQPANAGSAWVDGVELSYQQRYPNAPGVFRGLNFNGNFTYTNSEVFHVGPNRLYSNPHLLRQAPVSWNFGPGYERGRLSVNLGVEYNAASIYQYNYFDQTQNSDGSFSPVTQVGGIYGPNGDNYLYQHLQVDAQASYRLNHGFSVYASGQNLSNEVFGFYFGSSDYVAQREYYKPTYFGGVRWSLRHE